MSEGDALAELTRLIEAGEQEAVIAFLAPIGEKERRELRTGAAKIRERVLQERSADFNDPVVRRRLNCAELARVGTATWAQLKGAGAWPFHLAHRDPRLVQHPTFRVLGDRKPPWLQKWADWVCEDDWAVSIWPAVRAFELQGLVERPPGDAYYRGLARAFAWAEVEAIKPRLLADPELLEHHVFRFFEIEVALGGVWRETLLELAREGTIDRQRLLDACLDGLERDFDRRQAAWIKCLHDELEPTPEEIAARVERYRGLLSSRNPSTVKLALGVARHYPAADAKAARELVTELEPVLVARAKATARSGLKLLARTAKLHPALAGEIALAATGALLHDAAEIQGEALDLVEKLGLSDEVKGRLAELAPTMAPSVAARLGEVAPEVAPAEDAGADLDDLRRRVAELPEAVAERAGVSTAMAALETGTVPPPLDLDAEVPRLDPDRPIEPVADLDELLDLSAALLEGEPRAADIDRALDGISRLCAERPEDFAARSAPLARRAHEVIGEDISDLPMVYFFPIDFSLLVLGWLEGTDFIKTRRIVKAARWVGRLLDRVFPPAWELPLPTNDVAWVFSRFIEEMGHRVIHKQAAPLVSLPTHGGGWIDPRVLVERLYAAGEGPALGQIDVALAFLRLAPEHRAEALAAAGNLVGEVGNALRYALGGPPSIGRTRALWMAAARARAPRDDDPEVAALFNDATPGAAFKPRPTYELAPVKLFWRHHLTLEVKHEWRRRRRPRLKAQIPSAVYTLVPMERSVPWACHLWPANRDPLYLAAARALLAKDQGPFEGSRESIELLLDPDERLTGAAYWLLALALSRTQAEVRGLAVDILIAAFEDGRADPERLGRLLRSFVTVEELVPQRWVTPLGEVAGVSPLHAEGVRATLETALASREHAVSLRRLSAVLELFKELSVALDEPVEDAECRAFLESIPGSGANAKRAKTLLAIAGAGCSRHAIAGQGLESRVERARRWESR